MSVTAATAPGRPSNTKTSNVITSSSSLNLNSIFDTTSPSGGSGAALVTPAPPRRPLGNGRNTNSSSGARHRPTPGTASTDPLSKSVVVALVEGRGLARGEIGMASFDIRNPELVLAQFPDNRMYTNTLMKLQVLDPHEILLPKTLFEANTMPQLINQLKQDMPSINVTSLPRKLFNENLGIQYVRQLCVPEYSSVETEVVNKYYALSATAALVHYVEVMQNVACTAHSIKVVFSTGEGVARIDSTTMHDLELLTNTVDPRSSVSLFGVLNHAKTPGGLRLLRVNMLQPPCDLDTIVLRQKAVQQILDKMVEKDMALESALPLKVAYSQLRGFYIQMNYTGCIPDLPDKFIKVSVTKTTISFTTDSLVGY
ncbi:hypothetical protein HPB52_013133 [Rhipicephalus sanguineus]|uniref:Uncharacterized protein n=1 Tax=Rhipicephalus sanguineus TaxID=34632 RepID=A0A9D4QDR3_RHISA|nr:hypothetical protein HPB52_013133 [Rhipicephalus sanguineus]